MKIFGLVLSAVLFLVLVIMVSYKSFQEGSTEIQQAPSKRTIESLVMPAPVVVSHAKYETECSKCHTPFSQVTQKSLCIDCHKDIKQDLATKKGFHGISLAVAEQKCSSCHTEHEGRNANIVPIDKETFKHTETNFHLKGSHANSAISCDACHKKDKKFREAPTDCFSCHKQDDRHEGKLGNDCTKCHNEKSWKDTFFNHNDTKFKLVGEHKKAECTACHTTTSYKNTPKDCKSCHFINDIHDSPKKQECDNCHKPNGWLNINFNHNKSTDFKLEHRHADVECSACHQDLVFKDKLTPKCASCHKIDDIHKGSNGNKCDSCHSVKKWSSVSFNHDKDTKFTLKGKHKKAQCSACHNEGETFKKVPSCSSCHKSDDTHNGSLGNKCDSCHNESGWSENIQFDHDITDFPLIGLHAVTSCAECHNSASYKDTSMECAKCHEKDDFHKGSLGNKCSNCHNPNSWNLWQFDHDTQTKFHLNGSHAGLSCAKCHKGKIKEQHLAKKCSDCHESVNHTEDYGILEKKCNLCHTETSFQKIDKDAIKSFHEKPDEFGVSLTKNCFICHENNDIHNGSFGERCDRCHTVKSFKDIKIR
jgi:hypothetical protein